MTIGCNTLLFGNNLTRCKQLAEVVTAVNEGKLWRGESLKRLLMVR